MKDFDFMPSSVSVDVLAFIVQLVNRLYVDHDFDGYTLNVCDSSLSEEEFELFKKYLTVYEER